MATGTELKLLVDWDEGDIRARRRESTAGAAVLHLAFLIAVLISPNFALAQFFGVEPIVMEPVEVLPEVTVLYLPGEAPIPEKQPQPDLTPEERQRAVIRAPLTYDPRAQVPALPALPPSGSGDDSAPGAEAEEERGTAAESNPASQPGVGAESASGATPAESQPRLLSLDEIRPEPEVKPGTGLQLPPSAGEAIREALRNAPKAGGGSQGGDPGPIHPNLKTPFPIILSDTRGVDFGPYLMRILNNVRRNWYALMPPSVSLGEKGRVVIVFTITQDGSVPKGEPEIVLSSGRSYLDRPPYAAIRASQPFPPLPEEFDGENIVLQFTFLYNLPIESVTP